MQELIIFQKSLLASFKEWGPNQYLAQGKKAIEENSWYMYVSRFSWLYHQQQGFTSPNFPFSGMAGRITKGTTKIRRDN